MSQVKHRGVRRCLGGDGFVSSHVIYDYKSPGITLPHENPKYWEELSGTVKTFNMSELTPSELERHNIDTKKR